jgi:hypothetical protein
MLTLLAAVVLLAPADPAPTVQAPLACKTMNTDKLPLATRKSPLDSLSFKVGTADVKLCYGRPSARGRTMIGGNDVPFGKIWRTGANEPTMIHTTGPITIAGVAVPAGSYSIYTIPDPKQWHVIVNKSITQWGHESYYTAEVKAQEVGHGMANVSAVTTPVEEFTIRQEPGSAGGVNLQLEWEKTRVTVPVAAGR